MALKYKCNGFDIGFKKIDMSLVEKYLRAIGHVDLYGKHVIGVMVDDETLQMQERDMFLGYRYTPKLLYFWNQLYFDLLRIIAEEDFYSCGWLDVKGRPLIDTVDFASLNEIIIDIRLWENNIPNLFFGWGPHSIKDVYKKSLTFEGIFLPAVDGCGVIAVLNDKEYEFLKHNFPAEYDS